MTPAPPSGTTANAGGLIGRAQRAAQLAAPVFAAAGWTWEGGQGPHVPDEEEIFTTVLRLLTEVKTGHTLSTGRFHVTKTHDAPHTLWTVDLNLTDLWEDDRA